MGLIDRAIGELDAKESAASADQLAGARLFDINFSALSAKGFFTPDGPNQNQALELRAIKRRLLRRMGFLQRVGRDQRAMRATGRHRNLMMVTSTRSGEGKTFAAINLALSLAVEEGLSVVLIDADAPRPKIRSHFNLAEGPGLTDYLADPSVGLAAVSWRARQAPLTIVSEGNAVDNPTALFATEGAKRVFTDLSIRHPDRLIIIDTPPMLATTESLAIARHADEVVFVVEADATPEPAAATALDELLELNPNVSLILNRCLIPAGGTHYGSYEHYDRAGGVSGGLAEGAMPRGRR